jgi:hypothetical protein
VNKPVDLYYFYSCIHIFFYFFIIFIFLCFWGWAQLSPHGLGSTQPAQKSHWPKPVTRLGHTRHAWSKSRVHGPAIELNTDDENEIRQSGENRAGDLPGSFAGNLRVIAEDDASAFDFLLTPSAFHVVFLSCVLFLFIFLHFFCSVFRTNLYSLSVSFFFLLS